MSDSASGATEYGLLAEYASPEALCRAATALRAAGLTAWDAYTPFPIPDLEQTLELGPSRLPWLALSGALGGALGGAALQLWTNAVDYPWLVSNKPLFSLPESIPIVFALAMLGATVGVLIGLLVKGHWFEYSHPLDQSERFRRSTDDRFFVAVEVSDPRFDEGAVRQLLLDARPIAVELVPKNTTRERPPKALLFVLIAVGMAAVLPFPLLAVARQGQSTRPRAYLARGMDQQSPLRAQAESRFFRDGRATRPMPPGTVAWGELDDDEHYYRGKIDGAWARVLPRRFMIDEPAMQRGRDRYEVFCAPCHGLVGNGDGFVSKRAEELAEGTWVPPTDLHQDYLRRQPVGQLYDGLTNGVRKMAGLRALLLPDDRWAVVLYVRALQRSRHASLADIPPPEREALE